MTLDDFATYEVSLADLEGLLSLAFASLHARQSVPVPVRRAHRVASATCERRLVADACLDVIRNEA